MFSPQNSNVNQAASADPPPAPAPAPTLPPPLPVKSRDARPHESSAPADSPPPPLTRSGTARVSFREPISSSYSLDEDDDEEEPREVGGNQQGEEEEEALGEKGRLYKGVPPQMDLLGEEELCCSLNSEAYITNMSPLIPSPTQMVSLISEVGTGAVSPRSRFSTLEQRGAIVARGPPDLGWMPWSGGARKTEVTATPHPLPSNPASTNMKTAAPPAPHHQTLRRRAISWDSPYLCPLSSENINPGRAPAKGRNGRGRSSETGG